MVVALSIASVMLGIATAEPGIAASGLPAATRFKGEARTAYQAANAFPQLARKLFCYCGCDKEKGAYHKKLYDCYADQHAVSCSICQGEMVRAAQYKRQGMGDAAIAKRIDFEYKSNYPYGQPSSALKRHRAALHEKA
jgi:hypothetical protein